jgi:hypothetical protein
MEILRLTGAPHLAIINRSDQDNPEALKLWRARLNQFFGEPSEFNAHHATFADRIELLQTLSNRKKSWREPLLQAIKELEMDWRDRIGECATIIVELLEECLTHREAEPAADKWAKCERQTEDLKRKFREVICSRELGAHRKLAERFRHSIDDLALGDGLFESGLFSNETWKMLGMNAAWLTAIMAGSGFAAGGIIDAHTGGASWGVGAAIGTAVGFTSGVVMGKRQPKLDVKMPIFGNKRQVAGSEICVGPYTAINFPWILIDRAVATFVHVANRAHARRDPLKIDAQAMKQVTDDLKISTDQWPKPELITCEGLFRRIRKRTATTKHFEKLHKVIADHLLNTLSQRMPVSRTQLTVSH